MSAEVVPDSREAVNVAKLVGARQALGMVAGRCSAADAELLCQIHDQKTYLSLSPSWETFCQEHFRISRRNADRTIRLFKEFGGSYFELSQLTRISPREFRAIASHVDGRSIYWKGEAIALIEANSEKVAAAVTELRESSAPAQASETAVADLAGFRRRCERVLIELGRLSQQCANHRDLEEIAYRMTMKFAEHFLAIFRHTRS